MKILTKKKQDEIINNMVSNAVFIVGKITNNLAETAYLIGGKKAMKSAMDSYNKRMRAIWGNKM